MPRPRQPDDSVDVIGHHDEGVQPHDWKVVWDGSPATLDDPADPARLHLVVDDGAE
jgi:hypothetical protein